MDHTEFKQYLSHLECSVERPMHKHTAQLSDVLLSARIVQARQITRDGLRSA